VFEAAGRVEEGRTGVFELIDLVCLLALLFRKHCGKDARAGTEIQLDVADLMSRPVVPAFMMSSRNTLV
jgi:hypothetical protein